ncbi:MAG: hypothetical protein ACOYJ2_03505 [Rickettsiales bacterium]
MATSPILEALRQAQQITTGVQAAREEGLNLFKAGASIIQGGENLIGAAKAFDARQAAKQAATAIRESLDGLDGKADARIAGIRIQSVNIGRSQE